MLNLDGSYQFIGASAFVICDHPIGSNLFVAEDVGAFLDYSELLVLFLAERYDLGIRAKQVSTPTGAEGFLIDL